MRSPKALEASVAEMRKSGDWSSASPAEIVELCCWCHAMVYGVRPPELDVGGERGKRERMAAVSAARSLLEREFRGEVVELVAYVRWAWNREEGREKWAREKGVIRHSRLSWRALFSARHVFGDYQRQVAAAAKRVRA